MCTLVWFVAEGDQIWQGRSFGLFDDSKILQVINYHARLIGFRLDGIARLLSNLYMCSNECHSIFSGFFSFISLSLYGGKHRDDCQHESDQIWKDMPSSFRSGHKSKWNRWKWFSYVERMDSACFLAEDDREERRKIKKLRWCWQTRATHLEVSQGHQT